MQQLGQQFVQSFLLPHIVGKILPQVETDTKLQHIWQKDKTLTYDELTALETTLFVNTGTIFEKDLNMAKLFVEGDKSKGIIGFVEFIQIQSEIAGDSVAKLANRTLLGPDGHLSDEAEKQWYLFSGWMINGIQKVRADDLLKKAKAAGKLNKKNDKQELAVKDGKFLIVKGKDKKSKLLTEEQLQKQLAMWDEIYYDEPSGVGKVAYSLNPLELPDEGKDEKGSTRLQLQEQMWTNFSIQLEQKLMKSGFFVKSPLRVDQNGTAYGDVEDKRGAKLRVEFSLIKKGKIRFTFADNTKRNFSVSTDNLNNYFGKGQSAQEVYLTKQSEERRKSDMPINDIKKLLKENRVSMVTAVPPRSTVQPDDQEPPSVTTLDKRGQASKTPAQLTIASGSINRERTEANKQATPISEKQSFEQQYSSQRNLESEKERSLTGKKYGRKDKSKNKQNAKNQKSPVLQAIKLNAIAGGGGVASGLIYSFLTSGTT